MRPRPRLAALALGWGGVGLAYPWLPAAAPAWAALGLGLLALAAVDLWRLARLPAPQLRRRTGRALPLGTWSPVTLELTNPGRAPLRLEIHDLHPPEVAVSGLPAQVRLPAGGRARVDYRLLPQARGDLPLAGCDALLRSPLGLWEGRRTLPPGETLRVFPNFAEIARYTLLAANDQLAELGVRRLPRRGVGTELHQLREFREGDSLRQIDWKATARVGRPISREYQDERDQRLVFLLDCGRRMRHRDAPGAGGRAHLDAALNALLLLAYVAVRQGDAVGLMTYGGARRWLAPRKDADTVARLLRHTYDLQPGLGAADPLAAARELLAALPRRALVVILTNSRDEDQDGLRAAVGLLGRRHLVLVADLREAALDRALGQPVDDLDGALRLHAVHAWLAARRRHQERLRHLGVHTLDLLPEELPAALLNRYFDIKRAGSL